MIDEKNIDTKRQWEVAEYNEVDVRQLLVDIGIDPVRFEKIVEANHITSLGRELDISRPLSQQELHALNESIAGKYRCIIQQNKKPNYGARLRNEQRQGFADFKRELLQSGEFPEEDNNLTTAPDDEYIYSLLITKPIV